MSRIIKNRVRCNICGDVIESVFCHDMRSCTCGRVSVDGGKDYIRRCFTNGVDDYTELSEFED